VFRFIMRIGIACDTATRQCTRVVTCRRSTHSVVPTAPECHVSHDGYACEMYQKRFHCCFELTSEVG
jgi:hypothetical protein